LWVDLNKFVIKKVETSTKTAGTFWIDMHYNENSLYPLPCSMVFSINTEQFKGQGGFKKNIEGGDKQKAGKDSSTGKVYIYYNDYKVNKGIPDSIFEDSKK